MLMIHSGTDHRLLAFRNPNLGAVKWLGCHVPAKIYVTLLSGSKVNGKTIIDSLDQSVGIPDGPSHQPWELNVHT